MKQIESYSYGIIARISQGGEYGSFDFMEFLSLLPGFIVYFAIATFAADVVMFNVLGDKIYVKMYDWTLSDYQPSSYRRTSVQENK